MTNDLDYYEFDGYDEWVADHVKNTVTAPARLMHDLYRAVGIIDRDEQRARSTAVTLAYNDRQREGGQ